VVAFPWSDGWYWDGVSGFCVMYWLFINYCGYYFALAVVLCWVFVRVCLGAERWCGFVWVGSLRG